MINLEMEATKIVEIIDGKKCPDGTTDKIVKVVNETCLEILKSNDFKDIPILVFSIAGKTRGGKSFLLNLMIMYLEFQDNSNKNRTVDNWFMGKVPNCFPYKNGTKPFTKGLWIWPRIYKVKAKDGSYVGILLLDNEGMFGSDATDAEIIAMSGISTAISYLQMMNVKESITGDYLQSIVCYLGKGLESVEEGRKKEEKEKEENNDRENHSEPGHKLMFIVRDWDDTKRFAYGLCFRYIEEEMENSGEDNKSKWEEVRKTFPDLESVLLPHPGLIIKTDNFSGDLSKLEKDFCKETKKFIETLFNPKRLLPEKYSPNGGGLYEMIMKFNDKVADGTLSFMNLFTERINFFKIEALKREFEQELDNELHPNNVKTLMETIMKKAEEVLMKGRSYQPHLEDLRSVLAKYVNKSVQKYVLNIYEENINCSTKDHESSWNDLTVLLEDIICGDEEAKMNTLHKVAKAAAKVYYKKLREEEVKCFTTECKNKSISQLAGFDNSFIKSKFKVCEDFGVLAGDKNIVYPIWLMERDNLKNEIDEEFLKKVAVLTNKTEEWLKRVKRKQYEYFEASTVLKSEISYNKNDETLLKKKIGYVLFGPPSLNQDKYSNLKDLINFVCNHNEKGELGYLDSQTEKIQLIYDKVVALSKSDAVLLSGTFIIYNNNEDDKEINVPIFRIRDESGKYYFLDSNATIYEEWADCLTSNVLASVTYCYPCNGFYDKKVGFEVAFVNSPPKTISSKLMDFAVNIGNASRFLAQVVSAPLVGGFTIVGESLAKTYRWVTGNKYIDKHSEKEILSHFISVVSMGAGAIGGRLFSAVTGLPVNVLDLEVVTVICSSDERTAIRSLLIDIFEHSLKVLYYFNANSTENAVEIIQHELEIEKETSIPKTLETLLENSCVNSSKKVIGEIVMGKYISQNVNDIVNSLLKTNRKPLSFISKQLCIDHKLTIEDNFNSEPFADIFNEFVKENKCIKEKLINNNCMAFLPSGNVLHMVLAARYLLCSDISKVILANSRKNHFNHMACEKLVGYDSDFQPLDEVVKQITTVDDQNQSLMKLSHYDSGIYEVLYKLMETCSAYLTAYNASKYVNSVINTSNDLFRIFDINLESVENFISLNDVKYDNLKEILKNVDTNGKFGIKMLYQVINIFMNVQNSHVNNRKVTNITIVPAWSGVLDRIYMYYSDAKLTDKICLIKDFIVYKGDKTYKKHRIDNELFSLISDDESLPLFVIYAPNDHNIEGECGLIWHSEEPKKDC